MSFFNFSDEVDPRLEDEHYMRLALQEAQKAFEADEIPMGVEVDDPTAPLEREASFGEPEYLDRPAWLEDVAPG